MKVTNPLMSRFAAGTIGHQLIYRKTPRGHAAYLHFNPEQPNSAAQQAHHALFQLLANRWNYLDHEDRELWLPTAQANRITRYNAYMSYNLQRLRPVQLEGLLAWWPGLVPGSCFLHDLIPGRKDAEFVNMSPDTAWAADNVRRGLVIEFPGDGYCNVPDPPSTTDDYTWTFWFKQNAYTGGSAIVDTGYIGRYMHARFGAQRTAHVLKNTWARSTQMFLNDFTWHHYAGGWQGTDLEIRIDGIFHAITPQNVAPAEQITMRFGAHSIGVPFVGFRGRLDDLRFYTRFLTPADVLELAAA